MCTLFHSKSVFRYLSIWIGLAFLSQVGSVFAQDTLRNDNNVPTRAFKFPDAYGDDYRNMRFRAFHEGTLAGVMFALPTRNHTQYTTGDPVLEVLAWASTADSLPDPQTILLRDTVAFADYSASIFPLDSAWTGEPANFVIVDLRDYDLRVTTVDMFHLGYSALRNSPDDSLAILADGNTASIYSSEFYNGQFVTIRDGWGIGTSFLIRAIIETPDGTHILAPNGVEDFRLNVAFPNPFNPTTTLSIELPHSGVVTLHVFDLLGRETLLQNLGPLSSGNHLLSVNGASWSSGIYFARLDFSNFQHTVQLILEK